MCAMSREVMCHTLTLSSEHASALLIFNNAQDFQAKILHQKKHTTLLQQDYQSTHQILKCKILSIFGKKKVFTHEKKYKK